MVDDERRHDNESSKRNIKKRNIKKCKTNKKMGRKRKVLKLNQKDQPFFMKREFWKFYTIWWRRQGRGGDQIALGSVYYHWGVWAGVLKSEVGIAVVGATKKEAAWRLYRLACERIDNPQ